MSAVIAIIDANEQHRSQVKSVLASLHTVNTYDNPTNAIAGMHLSMPSLILVGQRVGAGNGAIFIKDLRKELAFADIPVLFIVDSEDFRIIDQMRDLGIRDYLVKPYSRSTLINLVSQNVNTRVERTWHDLPPDQRKALEGTLSAFNSVASDIASGKPLDFESIQESCSVMVEAISQDELNSLFDKMRDHDNFTFVHSLRVAGFLSLFGRAIGLPKAQQVQLASGGILHDIGKVAIPRALLNKQEPLTTKDWAIMRGHVETSEKIIATSHAIPKGIATIVAHHHERLDGTGYPFGLRAPQLNELARMSAIIDVFCALTDRRPYKRTFSPHAAMDIMVAEMKHQIDIDLLQKFREILLDTASEMPSPSL